MYGRKNFGPNRDGGRISLMVFHGYCLHPEAQQGDPLVQDGAIIESADGDVIRATQDKLCYGGWPIKKTFLYTSKP